MIYGGIDAGGTSSKCVLINERGEVLADVKAGPANYQVAGIEKAIEEINKVIKIACEKARVENIDIMGIGMAGAGGSFDLEKIKERLLPLNFVNKAYITDDGMIAVLGAHVGNPGIVLIAGTGSIVYGFGNNEEIVRAGGWGPLLGDEGSGFWIGLNALKEIIKASENRGKKTSLKKLILKKLNIKNLRELVNFTYQPSLPRREIASLAPLVIKEMQKGDKRAVKIINEGLEELAITCRSVMESISISKNKETKKEYYLKIAVMGGLFDNTFFYNKFTKFINNEYDYEVMRPRYPAVYGAVLYGIRQTEKNKETNFHGFSLKE